MMISQSVAFFLFRLIVSSIIVAIQWYFYRRAMRYAREQGASKKLMRGVRILFLIFNIPFVFLVFLRPKLLDLPEWFMLAGVYPFYIWHGTSVFLFLVLAVLRVIRLPFRGLRWAALRIKPVHSAIARIQSTEKYRRLDNSRRVFLQRGFTLLAGTTFGGVVYGAAARNDFEVTRINIPLKNLPPSFEGFTITLAADIHSGLFMSKEEMKGYVEAINELSSDLIVLPGDFVNSTLAEVYPFAEAFSDLKAPYGMFGTLGNHDLFTNGDAVAKEVDDCGVKVLRNDRIEITKDDGLIQLLGVDDVGRSERASKLFDYVLRGTRADVPRILLCHRPYFFDAAAERGVDLMLSGHTHGGQIVMLTIGRTVITPALIASPYVWGHYRKQNSHMYVTRGLGVVGFPVRINCPPEIAKITLTRAS